MVKPNTKRWSQKVLSVMLSLLVVMTTANPMTVSAQEHDEVIPADGNQYTVSLTTTKAADDSNLGVMTFKGDNESKDKEVTSGKTVTVNYSAVEGYLVDMITVSTEDQEAVQFKDNGSSISFTMPNANVNVRTIILPKAQDKEPLNVQKDNVDEALAYILENLNREYVGEGDTLTVADVMTLALTIIEGKDVTTHTLDGLWLEDANNDGIADNWRSVVNQTQTQALLYELDSASDYYVGSIDTVSTSDIRLVDWLAGENSTDGITYDDIILDEVTGLIYVPKTYRVVEEDGSAIIDSIRTQVLYVVEDRTQAQAEFNLSVTVDGFKGKFESTGRIQADIGLLDTTIQLAKNQKAMTSLRDGAKILVALNGAELGSDMYEYNASNGKLTLNVAPTSIETLDLVISRDIATTLDDKAPELMTFSQGARLTTSLADGMRALAAEPYALRPYQVGTFTFDKVPVVGDTLIVDGTTPYLGGGNHPSGNPELGNGNPSYTYPYGLYHSSGSVPSTESVIQSIIGGNVTQIKAYAPLMTGSPGVNVLWTNIQRAAIMGAQTKTSRGGAEVSIPAMNLNLFCSHIGISLDFVNDGSDQFGNNTVSQLMIGVVDVTADSLIFAVVTPTTHTQAGIGMFSAPWELSERNGFATAVKYSANPEYTNGNDAYDLAGAHYQIYTNAAANRVATPVSGSLPLVTRANGTMNTVELVEGTYWMKEIKAPNKGYGINPNIVRFEVSADATVTTHLNGENAEPTLFDPIGILVEKAVSEMDEGAQPNGDIIDFSGAQFKIEFFSGLYSTEAAAKASGNLKASAVWETRANGRVYFRADNPISGSWSYRDPATGSRTIPLGTILITEVKGIPGTIVSGAGRIIQFTDDGNGRPKATVMDPWSGKVTDGDITMAFDNVSMKGGFTVVKADTDLNLSKPQGDATLENVTYTIYNQSKEAVRVDVNGTWVTADVGDKIMDVKTIFDATNNRYVATTGEQVLPYGSYKVVETDPSVGYNNNAWEATFIIDHDGRMVTYENANDGWNRNDVLRYGVVIGKVDRETLEHLNLGDATLVGADVDVYNRSRNAVVVDGKEIAPNAVVGRLKVVEENGKFVAKSRPNWLPYGKYEAVEVKTSNAGYLFDDVSKTWSQTFTLGYSSKYSTVNPGEYADLTDGRNGAVSNQIMKGGFSVTKADADWNESKPQGDASLEGVTYGIYNRSKNQVYVRVNGSWKFVGVNEKVMDVTTTYDAVAKSHVATTGNNILPYGSYEAIEEVPSVGYHNNGWRQTFSIRQDGQMVEYTNTNWNTNDVLRYGVVIGKVDRETGQYIELGGATLEGAVFEIVNHSENAVFVDGVTYQPGEAVGRLSTAKEVDADGNVTFAARSAKDWLPYGNYSVREVKSSKGYIYDDISKAWSKTFSLGYGGSFDAFVTDVEGYADLSSLTDAVSNQVMREDFHFKKKMLDNDLGDDIGALIPFVIESKTTGEKHVIVTDENGGWGSSWYPHSDQTNANDPDSPLSNGAIGINDDGSYYVIDETLLNPEAGIWFTGMPLELSDWASDGQSYDVNGTKIPVVDATSSFPYDRYTMTELEVSGNKNYFMLSVNVALTQMGKDGQGGLDYDYGTINNRMEPIPEIGTMLNHEGGIELVPNDSNVTLTDTVEYLNLRTRTEYTLKGELHYVNAEGEDMGVVAEGETTFTTTLQNVGSIDVVFTDVDTSTLGNGKLVAFEYLYLDGKRVAEHADIEDEYQTVYVPEIGTTLAGDIEHEADGDMGEITLVDTVEYKNLIVGKTYTMNGTLQYQEVDVDGNIVDGGVLLDKDGVEVSASTEFTPVEPDGSVDVVFTFETDGLAGQTVVAFEELIHNDIVYARHADIEDAAQTVRFPVMTSVATHNDGGKMIPATKDQVIKDVVSFDNLSVGKEYSVTGELHFAELNGEGAILDVGTYTNAETGEVYQASVTFIAEATSQDVEVLFTIDASDLGGKHIVVFEALSRDGVHLGSHADIADANQRVHVPLIKTELTRLGDGSKFIDARDIDEDGTFTLVDTIAYENLTPNQTYRMEGELHIGELDDDGNIVDMGALEGVLGSTEFTPVRASGLVDVEFTFELPEDLTGQSLVAFEKLFSAEGVLIAVHEDITDEGQTVVFGRIGTQAVSEATEGQMVEETSETIRIVDTVEYVGLTPGTEYTVSGSLHIQTTDENGDITNAGILLDREGNEVRAEQTFIPTSADGAVDVVFEFIAPENFSNVTLVAFEDVSLDGVIILSHADITDEKQSVYKMSMATIATSSDGKKVIGEATEVSVVDKVQYENLLPGYEYTLTGILMVKHEDGSVTVAKSANGEDSIGALNFTPETPNGEVEMVFAVDTSQLGGLDLVAFERLSVANGTVIGSHEDINDEGQTVRVDKATPPAPIVPPTPRPQVPGDAPTNALANMVGLTAALLVGAGIVGVVLYRSRKKD